MNNIDEDLIKKFIDRISDAPKRDGRYQYPYVELEDVIVNEINFLVTSFFDKRK